MNRASLSIKIAAAALLVIGMCVLWADLDAHKAQTQYHISAWSYMAPEVERTLPGGVKFKPSALGHIYGGMAPHHIPATIPKLVEFYGGLKETQKVKNFIIIGPDHTDAGKAPVTVSNISFDTIFGELDPIEGLPSALQKLGFVSIEEPPFENEHSVGSQILIISKLFPGAHVTPIILRSNVTREQALILGKVLSQYLDEETVLIASVDFSHYLSTNQALPLDQVSGSVLKELDLERSAFIAADSSESALVFMKALLEKKATDVDGFKVLNTNDVMQNTDYTTGYVFGYWGVK